MKETLTWKDGNLAGFAHSIIKSHKGYLPFKDYSRHGEQSERNYAYEITFDIEDDIWLLIETEQWFWTVSNLFPSVPTAAAEYKTLEEAQEAAQKHFEEILKFMNK